VDGLRATNSEGGGLIVRAISFEGFRPGNLCGPDPPTFQTDGQMDRTDDDVHSKYRALHCRPLVHRAVKTKLMQRNMRTTFKSINYKGLR